MASDLSWKLTPIGNSRGIRIPQSLIEKYGLEGGVLVEVHDDHLVLKPRLPSKNKLSWKATYQAMAQDSDLEPEWTSTDHDGLDEVPWKGAKK